MSEPVKWTADDWVQVGTADADEGPVDVWRRRDGAVSLDVPGLDDGVFLEPEARDKLRELLDRTAMPDGAEAHPGAPGEVLA